MQQIRGDARWVLTPYLICPQDHPESGMIAAVLVRSPLEGSALAGGPLVGGPLVGGPLVGGPRPTLPPIKPGPLDLSSLSGVLWLFSNDSSLHRRGIGAGVGVGVGVGSSVSVAPPSTPPPLSSFQEAFVDIVDFLNQYYLPAIIALGLVGNLLSCVVFLNTHLRLRSSSYYLAALASVDFCFLVSLVLVWLNSMHGVQVSTLHLIWSRKLFWSLLLIARKFYYLFTFLPFKSVYQIFLAI